jgi:flagellar basal-body rod protein FlgG
LILLENGVFVLVWGIGIDFALVLVENRSLTMVNGLYTARNSMMVLQNKLDNNAHNLANANTTAFKKSMMVSQSRVDVQRNDQYLLHQDEHQQMSENRVVFEQGNLIDTENSFDLAFTSSGFFQIMGENGEVQYTRAGHFTRNTNHELVTLGGRQVLDAGGYPIRVEGDEFSVGINGAVHIDGHFMGRLGIVDFESPADDLEQVGHNAYRAKEGVEPQVKMDAEVKQGALEASNVNVVDGMVEMIRIARHNEMNQKVVTSIDETLQKAVNEVGRVS